jgi:DNA-binding transcriptional regulator GbsR (MarR family)
MELTPVARKFVLHWGEMGNAWGVNRSISQIHALLFVAGRPLNADDITDTLGIARSNVSNSLRELQSWGLIQTVHLMGDRRDHFTTQTDVWELFRVVVRERKSREFEPTIKVLRSLLESSDFKLEDAGAQLRIKETLMLMETLSSWAEEMLALETATLSKLLKLGSKVQRALRGVEPEIAARTPPLPPPF